MNKQKLLKSLADVKLENNKLRHLLLKKSITYYPSTGVMERKSTGNLLVTNDSNEFTFTFSGISTTGRRAAYLYMTGKEAEGYLYLIDRNPSNLKWNNITLNQHRVNSRDEFEKVVPGANEQRVSDAKLKIELTPVAIRWYQKHESWVLIRAVGRRVINCGKYSTQEAAYAAAFKINSAMAMKHDGFGWKDTIPKIIN